MNHQVGEAGGNPLGGRTRPGWPGFEPTGRYLRRPEKWILSGRQCMGLVCGALLLTACERQADRVFDRNPEYAGKVDIHEHYPDAETLRKRVLMGQTDR